MPKTATVFKDIGKLCNDLLTKDYKVGKTTIEVKSKTASGVTFTPTATKATNKAGAEEVSGNLKAAYPILPWLNGEANFDTKGGVSLSIEAADALTKGLLLTAECERAAPGKPGLLASANLIADYKSELFSCKASYDYYKKDFLASASTVYDSLAFGIDCLYCTRKGALQTYAAACQFVQPEFTVSAKCADKSGNKTLSCAYYHKVSGDMQLGVDIAKPLSKSDMSIVFGAAYKLDKDTAVKAKVDDKGKLSTSYKQKISSLTTMTLAAEVDTVNLADNKHKFGLQLNITP
jgi:voltage-dependent anion channel protein 2